MSVHAVTSILPCSDLDRSEAFYGRLGLVRRPQGQRPPEGDSDYRILTDNHGAHLHLIQAVEGWLVPGRNPFGLYLHVEDVDRLAAVFAGEWIEEGGPEHKPWGMYEFSLSDPDQALIRVGWPSSVFR